MDLNEFIKITSKMSDLYPEDSKFRGEFVRLCRKILKLYITSSNQNLYAYQHAIEGLDECCSVIEEYLDTITDKDLPVYHKEDTAELIIQILESSQEPEQN